MSKPNKGLLRARKKRLISNGYVLSRNRNELIEQMKGFICYFDNDDKYESGGFLREIKENSFTWSNKYDDDVVKEVPFDKVKEIYTKMPLYLLNRSLTKKTNFVATISGIPIYYAQDNFDLARFKNTDRYIELKKWYKDNRPQVKKYLRDRAAPRQDNLLTSENGGSTDQSNNRLMTFEETPPTIPEKKKQEDSSSSAFFSKKKSSKKYGSKTLKKLKNYIRK